MQKPCLGVKSFFMIGCHDDSWDLGDELRNEGNEVLQVSFWALFDLFSFKKSMCVVERFSKSINGFSLDRGVGEYAQRIEGVAKIPSID